MSIPAKVHFCWIGTRLPWAYVFAVLSAAERGGLPEVILNHTDPLEDCAETRALTGAIGVTLRRIDPVARLTEAGDVLGVGAGLALLYGRIASPIMRADILRAAILFQDGGIYLDLDTITVASLTPLLDTLQFVGCEYIVWPHSVRTSGSPARWARSLALDLFRKTLRNKADGWKGFRRIEWMYYRGLNNAVMGAEPNSPFFGRYLKAMLTVKPERLLEAYALGPDLLQSTAGDKQTDDLIVHDPQVFYPLPPEISEHWFRACNTVRLDAVLSHETRVVHWYASVRTKSRVAQITPSYVGEHRQTQLYSALVCACIANLPAAA
jgi:hypothetical protein